MKPIKYSIRDEMDPGQYYSELIAVTNRLQAIHDKAENAAKSDVLLEQIGRRLIAMESNNFKEIINDARDCEQIADELINRQK